MGMYKHKHTGCLASVLFVILHLSASAPDISQTRIKSPSRTQYKGCQQYQVGQNISAEEVTLDETLLFKLKPNHAMLIMDIVVSDQQRYQATIDASRIELDQCNMDYTNCTTIRQEAMKSSDILNANKWNYVNVTLVENQITVSVNMQQNVMGSAMFMQSEDQDHSSAKVSILSRDMMNKTTVSDDYSVDVDVYCNGTFTPTMTEKPAITNGSEKTNPAPFQTCPLYEVRQGLPLQTVKLQDSMTLAVFPSQPVLSMEIMAHEDLYKATIDGTMTDLLKCNKDGDDCTGGDAGGAKASNMFEANKWNFVVLLLTDTEVTLKVNMKDEVMRKAMSVHSDTDYANVTIMTIDDSSQTSANSNYTVAVNVECNDTVRIEPYTITTSTTTTTSTISTITENVTTQPGTDYLTVHESGKIALIILGILAVILIILVAALVYSCCRDKRSMDISQHVQLEEQ